MGIFQQKIGMAFAAYLFDCRSDCIDQMLSAMESQMTYEAEIQQCGRRIARHAPPFEATEPVSDDIVGLDNPEDDGEDFPDDEDE